MNCYICGQQAQLLEQYRSTPHGLMGMYGGELLQLRDVELYSCISCGHMQMVSFVDDNYYKHYFLGGYWGSSFRSVRQKQVSYLVNRLSSTERLLDIGCGAGHYLELAKPYFQEVVGIEPSKLSAHEARSKGFNVIQDYFNEDTSFDYFFDAITFVEVLEHIEYPLPILKHASSLLKDDGILLIEVPNGQRIRSMRLFYNLCTDHIHYFSISSLVQLVQLAGLKVVCARECDDPNLIEIYAKKDKSVNLSFSDARQKSVENLISSISDNNKPIAAWGAGAEAATFVPMLRNKVKIAAIFDSDEGKHGLCIDNIPIKAATAMEVQEYEHIILFANSHKRQIEGQLEELGYKGQLHIISAYKGEAI